MNRFVKCLLLAGCLQVASMASAQVLPDAARANIEHAIDLMDNGQVDESIKLLKETEKLAPKNYIVPYELGFAYQLKKDYPTAISYFKQASKCKDANDQCYAMLGNMHSYNGDPKKALETYDKGLKIFPNAGRIHLEKGNIYLHAKQYNEAMKNYEKGIQVDPGFPSNYYRAALIYLNTEDEVWGMIYGELFMNLERGTERTEKISSLLYETYKSQIKVLSDSSTSVSFSSNTIVLPKGKDAMKSFKLPYGNTVYEMVLLLAVLNEKVIDLAAMDRIRTRFLKTYYEQEREKTYPNALFAFQKKVSDAGHLEAYNYWILSEGSPEDFEKWRTSNRGKWDIFVDWFNKNQLVLDDTNKFSRFQY